MSTRSSIVTRLAAAVALSLAPLGLLAVVAPWVPSRGLGSVAVAFAISVLALLGGVVVLPYVELRALRVALASVVAGLVAMGAGFAVARGGHGAVASEVVAGLVGSGGVMLAAGALGAAVGSRVAHPGHLVAVALASSAADVWSVHAPEGVTRSLVETPDFALQRLFALSAAVPPSRVPFAAIGAGDVVFVALYLAAAYRHGLSFRRIAIALGIGLACAGAMTFVFHMALPALPFLGLGVVLADRRARTVARGDRWPTALAGAIFAAAIVRVALR
jgi:hypothetical protein